jgi:hypothetical protein
VGLATPSDDGSYATRPSGTDRPNMKETKSAQDQYEKEGKKAAVPYIGMDLLPQDIGAAA